MKKNILGQVLVLLISILGLLFFIFSLVSSFTEIDENKISTFALTGWLLLIFINRLNHSLSIN